MSAEAVARIRLALEGSPAVVQSLRPLLGVGGLVAYGVNQNDEALHQVLDAQTRLLCVTGFWHE